MVEEVDGFALLDVCEEDCLVDMAASTRGWGVRRRTEDEGGGGRRRRGMTVGSLRILIAA